MKRLFSVGVLGLAVQFLPAQPIAAERLDSVVTRPLNVFKWFGDVQITRQNNRLWFQSKRSPQLRGALFSGFRFSRSN